MTPAEPRSLVLLNEHGDIEINWDADADERMRGIIAKKMAEGVRFFTVVPVLGGALHIKKRLKDAAKLQTSRITVKDEDLDKLFQEGAVRLERRDAGSLKVGAPVSDPAVAARTSTVGVRPLAGG